MRRRHIHRANARALAHLSDVLEKTAQKMAHKERMLLEAREESAKQLKSGKAEGDKEHERAMFSRDSPRASPPRDRGRDGSSDT